MRADATEDSRGAKASKGETASGVPPQQVAPSHLQLLSRASLHPPHVQGQVVWGSREEAERREERPCKVLNAPQGTYGTTPTQT